MKAIRIHEHGGPETLRVDDVPTPAPGPGQALVDVEASGVNFIDVYYRLGQYKAQLPLTTGSEGAGTVLEVGEGVADVKPGDRVAWAMVLGSYAEQAVVPADRLVRVPPNVTTETAAAAMLQGMTAHYLSHSTYPLEKGSSCVVHAAAGGVGLLLCQMAKMRGAYVIGTVGNDEKARLAREAGADETIVYTRQDFEAEVKRLTEGRGVPVVYDSVGVDTFDRSLNCLQPRGYLVLFGQSSGPVPPVDPQVLAARGSLFLTRPTLAHYVAKRDELLERAGDVLGWIADGKLKLRVDRTYALADAGKAQEALTGRQTSGKVLLIP